MDILLIITVIITLGNVIYITHKTTDILYFRLPSINSIYYFMYLFIFIASIAVFLKATSHNKYTYLFMMVLGILGFSLGIILAAVVFKFNRKENRVYSYKDVVNSIIDKKPTIAFNILLFFSIFLIITYIYQVRNIPLFYMLQGGKNAHEFAVMRENSFKLLNSRLVYFYAWNRSVILPYLTMYSAVCMYLIKSRKWKINFIIVFLISIFNASFSGAEAPIAEIFLQVFFIYFILKKGKIKKVYYLLGGMLIFSYSFGLPLIMGDFSNAFNSLVSIIGKIAHRFTYDTAERLYKYVEIFSNDIGFLNGAGNRILAKLTGQKFFNIPNAVFRILYPDKLESGHMNAPNVGYAFANFGLMGVLIGGVINGFIGQSLQIYFVRKEKNSLNIIGYVFCINAYRKLLSAPITTVLVTHGIIIVVFLPYIIKQISLFFKKDVEFQRRT